MMDVNNFNNFTKAEYSANLLRLSIANHSDLIRLRKIDININKHRTNTDLAYLMAI